MLEKIFIAAALVVGLTAAPIAMATDASAHHHRHL